MKRFFKLTFPVAVVVLCAVISLRYVPHAAAKDLKSSKLSAASAATKATVPVTTSTTSLPTVTADMNAAINADPDGLSTAASLIDLNTGQQYNAGATATLSGAAAIRQQVLLRRLSCTKSSKAKPASAKTSMAPAPNNSSSR